MGSVDLSIQASANMIEPPPQSGADSPSNVPSFITHGISDGSPASSMMRRSSRDSAEAMGFGEASMPPPSAQMSMAPSVAPSKYGGCQSEALKEFVNRKAKEVFSHLTPQTVLVLEESETLLRFCELIHDRRLRSAVVRHDNVHRCCCRRVSYSFIDVRDVSYHIIRMKKNWKNKSFSEILEMCKSTTVGSIANASGRTPFIPYDINDSVARLCSAFKNCARVAVFEDKEIVRVFSPVDMLTLLQKLDLVKEFEPKQRQQVLQGSKEKVVTIMETETLLKALHMMERHSYSAVPIVAENDFSKVREVITVRDMKYLFLASDSLPSKDILNSPALEYVNFVRQPGRRPDPPYATMPEISELEDVFDRFVATKIHRIFLTDKRGRMSGMISLTSVSRSLADILGHTFHHRGVSILSKRPLPQVKDLTHGPSAGASEATSRT
ncbi:unnamed protein product [Vitrella brassicaformis CCMP3155]|uniref:CBS domain-containing protein n=2 Tax=Vitrella brassicaformis TaxID=1169539 RepID=A0A0G4H325_VITBC|nr:unnamed protein product [Vitrella brassicaformis CCMP3155]|eukprot:CEM37837.1 unnamed protein product [Vitrella brassicaformis CCMP3155]